MAAPKLERLKAADVCQIAQVQPYVLRTWETEFPDLGHSTAGGPRLYGRADVERVLKIKELVYGEGLTLGGARRRLEETRDEPTSKAVVEFSLFDVTTRARLKTVRDGLVAVLALLERPVGGAAFELVAAGGPQRAAASKPARRTKR